ncbi:MAG: hypothetical protein LBK52_02580 [Deltaproteobacteria bacterium]|nr:hypothetical protein [Deltaproteobacteria bacterium]
MDPGRKNLTPKPNKSAALLLMTDKADKEPRPEKNFRLNFKNYSSNWGKIKIAVLKADYRW